MLRAPAIEPAEGGAGLDGNVRPAPAGRVRAALDRHAAALTAAVAGLLWFAAHVGPSVLDPRSVAWLMGGDLATNYLGWAFFRSAPLALPLGASPFYLWPTGTSLAYTDSNPLVGVLLRPIAQLLPADFQYVGPWLGLCFALQGFVGAKLVRLVSPSRAVQVLGGALFALAPPLLHRVVGPNTGHASLSAHWLLLSALWLALAPARAAGARRRVVGAAALVLASTGVHPYHTVMVAALSGALLVRLRLVDRSVGWPTIALQGAALAGAATLGLLAFGFLAPGVDTRADGFGYFSADALSLVNPMGWSRTWGGFRVGAGQYEGFGYLGGGVLALAAVAAVLAVPARAMLGRSRWGAAIPAAAVAALLAILAASDTVTIAGAALGRIGAYDWIPFVGRTFRSSGRFVWPLHYLVVLGSIATLAVALRSRPRLAAAVFAAAVAVQAADVRPPVPMPRGEGWAPPSSDAWAAARGRYRHVAMVPPFVVTGSGGASPSCPIAFPPDAYVRAGSVAYRLPATFNSAYVARTNEDRAAAACVDLSASIAAGRLDPETIYVIHPWYRPLFAANGAACGVLDGMIVCARGSPGDPFALALRSAPAP